VEEALIKKYLSGNIDQESSIDKHYAKNINQKA